MTEYVPRSSLKWLLASGRIPFVVSPAFDAFNPHTAKLAPRSVRSQKKKIHKHTAILEIPTLEVVLYIISKEVTLLQGCKQSQCQGKHSHEKIDLKDDVGNYSQTKRMLDKWTWLKILCRWLQNIFSVVSGKLIQIHHSGSWYRIQVYHIGDHFSKTEINWTKQCPITQIVCELILVAIAQSLLLQCILQSCNTVNI